MPQDEPISSGVGPEVREAIKHAFSGLSANQTTVIESRLSGFKRDLIEERDVLSIVLSKQQVDVGFQRGARGPLLIPLTLRLQDLLQRVGFF